MQPGHQCVHDQGKPGGGPHHRQRGQARQLVGRALAAPTLVPSLSPTLIAACCPGPPSLPASPARHTHTHTHTPTETHTKHARARRMQVVPRPLAAHSPHRGHALPARLPGAEAEPGRGGGTPGVGGRPGGQRWVAPARSPAHAPPAPPPRPSSPSFPCCMRARARSAAPPPAWIAELLLPAMSAAAATAGSLVCRAGVLAVGRLPCCRGA